MVAGLTRFIVVLGTAALRKPSPLLMDQAESKLHPSLQADFLMSVASHAAYGTLFAAHSIGFA